MVSEVGIDVWQGARRGFDTDSDSCFYAPTFRRLVSRPAEGVLERPPNAEITWQEYRSSNSSAIRT